MNINFLIQNQSIEPLFNLHLPFVYKQLNKVVAIGDDTFLIKSLITN